MSAAVDKSDLSTDFEVLSGDADRCESLASMGQRVSESNLASVVCVGQDRHTAAEIKRLCDIAGVDVVHAASARTPGVLTFVMEEERFVVTASFHQLYAPYFATGRIRLHVRDDAADVLELIAAVGATMRGRVVGVIGAHGGSGASTLAAWIARLIAQGAQTSLVDLNPCSFGIDRVLGIDDQPGHRWGDLDGHGALMPGQVIDSLPQWHDVRVVSADARAAVPVGDGRDHGSRMITAVSQVSEWTILDLGVVGSSPDQGAWIDWCDVVVMVLRPDQNSLSAAVHAIRVIPARAELIVAGVGVSAKNEAAHVAQVVGVERVFPVRKVKGMRGDIDHGLSPGDRASSRTNRDVRDIVDYLVGSEL